jgi:hypothetical protein
MDKLLSIKYEVTMTVYMFVSTIQPGFRAITIDQSGSILPANFGWRPSKPISSITIAEDFSPATQHCAQHGFYVFDSITEPDPFKFG